MCRERREERRKKISASAVHFYGGCHSLTFSLTHTQEPCLLVGPAYLSTCPPVHLSADGCQVATPRTRAALPAPASALCSPTLSVMARPCATIPNSDSSSVARHPPQPAFVLTSTHDCPLWLLYLWLASLAFSGLLTLFRTGFSPSAAVISINRRTCSHQSRRRILFLKGAALPLLEYQ